MRLNVSDPEVMKDLQTVPTTTMETEPALTIGDIFASKQMIRTYVAALIAVLGTIFKFAVDDAFIDNVATLVQIAAIIATGILAKVEQSRLAKDQARTTREVVYAPATVERLVGDAAATGRAEVPDPPADDVV